MRFFCFCRRASYDAQGPFFGLYRGKDFFVAEKTCEFFWSKTEKPPFSNGSKKDKTTLKKRPLSFLT